MPFISRISRAEQNRKIKGCENRYRTILIGVGIVICNRRIAKPPDAVGLCVFMFTRGY